MDPHLRSLAEEIANSATHGIGLILSLVGSTILLSRVLPQPDAWRLAGCSIFATALADSVVKDRAQAARPLAWLAKPFNDRKLVATVQSALDEVDALPHAQP